MRFTLEGFGTAKRNPRKPGSTQGDFEFEGTVIRPEEDFIVPSMEVAGQGILGETDRLVIHHRADGAAAVPDKEMIPFPLNGAVVPGNLVRLVIRQGHVVCGEDRGSLALDFVLPSDPEGKFADGDHRFRETNLCVFRQCLQNH